MSDLSSNDLECELTSIPEGRKFLEEIGVEAAKALLAGDDDLYYKILDPLKEFSDWWYSQGVARGMFMAIKANGPEYSNCEGMPGRSGTA